MPGVLTDRLYTDMSVADLTLEQVNELSIYLDEFPREIKQLDVFGDVVTQDEYWRQLVRELSRLPRGKGRVNYTVVQIEDFASESCQNRSPSRRLLSDLQRARNPPSLESFKACLKRTGCVAAQNVFMNASEW